MDDSFWLATTAAATIATAIATGVTLWLRQRDRPEVHWQVAGRSSHKPEKDGLLPLPYERMRLVNAGDGTAYRVEVTGRNGVVWRVDKNGSPAFVDREIAIVRPGDEFFVRAYHEGAAKEVSVRIVWIPEPTRVSRPVTEVIPLAEGLEAARTGRRTGPNDWRHRELRPWQVLQRHRQWASRRARGQEWLRTVAERKAMNQWREAAVERSVKRAAEDRPEPGGASS